MKIVTFNLRFSWDNDGINSFIHRAGFIYDKIRKEKPDILAFQEMTPIALTLIERMLQEYRIVGQMRTENYDGEGIYTAVRKETFDVLGFESFALSPTPYIVGSRYENQSANPRICVLVKLREKRTNEVFRVLNTHLDDISEEARLLGVNGLFDFIDRYKGDPSPILLCGDFNARPNSAVVGVCKRFFDDATKDIPVTFHGFGKGAEKLDYIFLPKSWTKRIQEVGVWKDEHSGIYLSDHYPVCIRLSELV